MLPTIVWNRKLQITFTLALLSSVSVGCALSDNLIRTTFIQPAQFSDYWNEKRSLRHFRSLADQELERARAIARAELDNYQCEPFSADQERGFEDGFVDFLMYGGNGHPPPLPPRRYWQLKYQNPAGFVAIQDWFRGYQHGAAVAQASGYREFITISTSEPITKETLPVYPGQQFERLQAEEPASEVIDLPDPAEPLKSNDVRDAQPAATRNSLTFDRAEPMAEPGPQLSLGPSPKVAAAINARELDDPRSVHAPAPMLPAILEDENVVERGTPTMTAEIQPPESENVSPCAAEDVPLPPPASPATTDNTAIVLPEPFVDENQAGDHFSEGHFSEDHLVAPVPIIAAKEGQSQARVAPAGSHANNDRGILVRGLIVAGLLLLVAVLSLVVVRKQLQSMASVFASDFPIGPCNDAILQDV